MKTNGVHTYVEGGQFNNIFGGTSDAIYASITHIKYVSPEMQRKWPWLRNMWQLSTPRGYSEYYKTLREARARAQELWPDCYFKRPRDFAKELAQEAAASCA